MTVQDIDSDDTQQNPSRPFADNQQQITTINQPATGLITSGTIKISRDYLMNKGLTFEDPQNKGRYILVPNPSYCSESGLCLEGQLPQNFSVTFSNEGNVFYITLLAEPIAVAQRDAESFLSTVLNISSSQLCDLNYYLTISKYVDAQYAGQSLQFINCADQQSP